MARSEKSHDYSDLGSGTYFIPEVGTVMNGKLLDGNDPEQVRKFHEKDVASRETAAAAMAERDAAIVDAVQAPDASEPKE
jgi:hypothetical protein